MNPTSSVLIAICSFIFDTRASSARHTVSSVDVCGNLSRLHGIYVAWHVVAWEKDFQQELDVTVVT